MSSNLVEQKTSYVKTGRSELTMGSFTRSDIIRSAVDEVAGLLIHQPLMKIYGKDVNQQRDIGFFSDINASYSRSGVMSKSQKLTPNLAILLGEVNEYFRGQFTGILVNRYNDREDHIVAHSDDEKFIDPIAGAVAISWGASREMIIRPKVVDSSDPIIISLNHLSVIHMTGDFQKEFTHEIPPASEDGVRYSFTFRRHDT